MANDTFCVFCGQKLGTFRSTTVQCGITWQNSCRSCEKELKGLDEAELCRRALVRGIAEHPDRLRERIELITEAENYRPKCLRCGTAMTYMKEQLLDNSPLNDSLFHVPFEVLPAYCETCGKYEFFNPEIVRKNRYIAYLIQKDTEF